MSALAAHPRPDKREVDSGLPNPTHPHGRVAYFLPHQAVTLRGEKAKDYAARPTTIGEHIKRKRKLAGLTQLQVSERLAVSAYTVMNWELGNTDPPVTSMPAIIKFLGYDPSPPPVTLAGRMQAYRRQNGLSIKAAARCAGVHEDSWGQWERTGVVPWERHRSLLDDFLAKGGR